MVKSGYYYEMVEMPPGFSTTFYDNNETMQTTSIASSSGPAVVIPNKRTYVLVKMIESKITVFSLLLIFGMNFRNLCDVYLG